MISHQNTGELAAAAGKVLPPLTVSGVVMGGVTLQDWVLLATLVYTVLQVALLIYRFFSKEPTDADE